MQQEFSWNLLLSADRFPKPGETLSGGSAEIRTPFEADYDRVVFSSPFRRLAKKTQVHPLAPNDHIHNRLIHSLEVGSVGRSLGKKLQLFLADKDSTGLSQELLREIPLIVQIGCLIHDIGNPPFGHAGESSIREWIAEHKDIVFKEKFDLSCKTKKDLLNFEGNAQGFRLASRGDNSKSGYLRLTYASLGTMMKYPWGSCDKRLDEMKKKFSVYSTEFDFFMKMAEKMGLLLSDGTVARHPLSFLSEAADDICYRMLDMEDAVSMKIFQEEPIKKLFLQIASKESESDIPISVARGMAINSLIEESWRIYEEDYSNIIIGARKLDLKSNFSEKFKKDFDEIGALYKIIFSHRAKLAYEVGAYKILGRIIKSLTLAAQSLCAKKNYKNIEFVSQKCLDLAFGEDYIIKNQEKSYEWWIWQVFDYVSGLTDNYAIQISNEIEGVKF